MHRIREAPATIKILLIAIVLILLPGAVLSYVGCMSVNERARQLEAGYRGTLFLVCGKIDVEVLRLEQGLWPSVDNAATNLNNLSASRHLLQLLATKNPWLRRPFLASPAGDLITPSMSMGSSNPPGTSAPTLSLRTVPSAAETAEFAHKDPAAALQLLAGPRKSTFSRGTSHPAIACRPLPFQTG